MAEEEFDGGSFEMGRVFSRAFQAIGANIVLFLGLALILTGIPAFLAAWWQFGWMEPGDSAAMLAAFRSGDFWLPLAAVWGVSLVTSAVLQASLTRATAMHLAGEKPGFARCLAIGLTLILPMIALSLMIGIGVGIGFVLLVVPGVILWLYWSVAIPAFVQERIGIFDAFGRSAALTSGNRGSIFLVMLVMGIGLWVLSLCVNWLLGPVITGASTPLPASLVQAVVGAISSMVSVTVQTSVYVELRNVKDGVRPSELEAIFA